MTAAANRPYAYSQLTLHPFHALVLAGTFPLFLGALLTDIAYYRTYEIQWSTFSSWLIAGGLVFAGLALLSAVVSLIQGQGRHFGGVLYLILVLILWISGFLNALVHARDAWGAMPMGLMLSVVVILLTCAAIAVRFLDRHAGGAV